MKLMLFMMAVLIVPFSSKQDLNPKARAVLNAWISTQNEGSEAAVIDFIKLYYPKTAYSSQKKLKAHTDFCMQIVREFGNVQAGIYEVMENEPKKLKVQLLKAGTLAVTRPSPEDILVVEIDLEKRNGTRLERGLGMGALICYIKR